MLIMSLVLMSAHGRLAGRGPTRAAIPFEDEPRSVCQSLVFPVFVYSNNSAQADRNSIDNLQLSERKLNSLGK